MKENSIKNERSSIEKNIEILEKFKNNEMQRDKLERDARCGGWKIGDIYKYLELNNAIDNILSDYKRVLKENEELNYKLHSKKIALEIYNRYIPKSKVKDKIEQLKMNANYDWMYKYDYQDVVKMLQELLEEGEE